jgi:phage protein U
MSDETEADIVLQLDALAAYAERANHWTDDMRLMDAAGVADTVFGAIHRIEELEAKLKWVIGERDATFALMLKRAESAEAKLAKAVKALVKMVGKRDYADDPWEIASATLAELEGETE